MTVSFQQRMLRTEPPLRRKTFADESRRTMKKSDLSTRLIVWLALTVASAAWHCALGVIFSTASVQRGYSGAKPKIDTILGVVFIGLGIRLATAR